jgi:multisubunit Na+/H+ antiporter MnhB subunit
MFWEEIWRGRPMIDQQGDLWVVPTVIVIVTYFIGGSIAGRHRRKPRGAVVQGIALAVSTSLVLVIADIPRRLALGKGLPLNVIGLWLGAVAGTVVVATLGALFGRWLYRARRRRSVQMTKHG